MTDHMDSFGEQEWNRRTMLKAAGAAITCGTCSAISDTAEVAPIATANAQTMEWNELEVDGYPFTIQYRNGKRADAEQVRDWAIIGHDETQDVFPHELSDPITFKLYRETEWDRGAFDGVYRSNERTAEMMTPSDYDGDRSQLDFKHLVIHEYLHAPQGDLRNFHHHQRWFSEGFVEALTVFHTDEDLYQRYYNRRDARQIRQRIRDGYGFVMGVTEDKYRGAMHLLEFMITKYGGEAVSEIIQQDAGGLVEAMEMRLGITPLDLEREWLKYAQLAYGGDYAEEIERLGGRPTASLSIRADDTVPEGNILIDNAVHNDRDFVIVLSDQDGDVLTVSDQYSASTQLDEMHLSVPSRDSPYQVIATLHEPTQDGYGDPLTVYETTVSDSVLYRESASAIGFVSAPEPGDTAVSINAVVDEDYSGSQNIVINVMNSNSTNYIRRMNPPGEAIRISQGDTVIDHRVKLDASETGVPLEDGQTITAAMFDYDGDQVIVSETYTVGEMSESSDTGASTTAEQTTSTPDSLDATEQSTVSTDSGTSSGTSTSTQTHTSATDTIEPTETMADQTASSPTEVTTGDATGTTTSVTSGDTQVAAGATATTAAGTTTVSTSDSDDHTSSENGPGFGILAALTGVGVGVWNRARK